VRTKAQTELMIFLTPQVVAKPEELADLGRQLRSEMQRLDAAVEAGLLQRHLDQLMGLPTGQPIPPTTPAVEAK
jgi:type II secretory pathway component GspD/PulD (secretin)